MTIVFLHTSDVHVATFDALRDRIAPEIGVRHVVREDLLSLAVAQGGITGLVQEAAFEAMTGALTPAAQVLICTCSTLGPVAEAFDADAPIPVLRIDRPMADQAVLHTRHIAVCGTLATAVSATASLVRSSAEYLKQPSVVVTDHLFLSAWPLFERGDLEAYYRTVALGLRGVSMTTELILLAQASMEPAIALCKNIDIPIWSSPETGFRTALALAQSAVSSSHEART